MQQHFCGCCISYYYDTILLNDTMWNGNTMQQYNWGCFILHYIDTWIRWFNTDHVYLVSMYSRRLWKSFHLYWHLYNYTQAITLFGLSSEWVTMGVIMYTLGQYLHTQISEKVVNLKAFRNPHFLSLSSQTHPIPSHTQTTPLPTHGIIGPKTIGQLWSNLDIFLIVSSKAWKYF